MTLSTQLYADNASTTLAAGIGTSDTTFTVASGSGFPTPSAGQFFLATLSYSGVIEIVKVTSISGNTFSGIARGQGGSSVSSFPTGTVIECRVTAGTLAAFGRYIDRLYDISSVDLLAIPPASNGNSYICHSNEEVGNPVVAINAGTANTWRFLSHTLPVVTGSLSAVTTSNLTSTAIGTILASLQAGQYILQFVTGVNTGICREVASSTTNVVAWSTPLSTLPNVGDQFQIYQSNSSVLNTLISEAASPPSDPTKINVSNGNSTGTLTINGIIQVTNQTDVKIAITANTSSTNLNLSTGNMFKVTIAASTALTFSSPPTGSNVFSFGLITQNTSTGGYAVSFPGNVKWAGGVLPPRTTAANALDVWTFYTEDAGTTYVGSLSIVNAQ